MKLQRHRYRGRLVRLAPSIVFLAIVFTAWFSPVLKTQANNAVSSAAIAMPRPPSTTIRSVPTSVTIPSIPTTVTIPSVPTSVTIPNVPTSVTIPEVPTSLPVSVTIPEVPTSLPVSVTIPEIPSSIPTSITIPNIPSSLPTNITIPKTLSRITIPKSLSSLAASITIPKSLSSLPASITIPESLSGMTIPVIPSSLPESIVIPDVSLPTTVDDELINSLSTDLLSNEEVASIVNEITESVDITNDQAAILATSVKVLENLGLKKVAQIFNSIDVGNINEEQGEAIVETVQVANKTVRRSFEKNVNIYAGKFDTYVPLNSKIDVGDRRTVVAVSVVSTASVATMGVRGAMPMGGGAPAGGGSAELAEAFKSESSRIRRISKYKYKNGRRVVDKKNFARRLVLSIMQNSFTLVGFIVVYLTLSGSVRTIAGLATLIAFFSTLYIDMREED